MTSPYWAIVFAGIGIVVGNLTSVLVCYRISRNKTRSKMRSGNFALTRARRVARARICEGCNRRGRQGHAWFCASGDIPLFNYHDMNTHSGLKH